MGAPAGTTWRPDLAGRLVLLAVTLALWADRLRGPLDLRWDAGAYYATGVALGEGRGYRLLNEPGDPEAVQYPPGLPLIVAAAVRLLGTRDPDVVGEGLRTVWLLLSVVQLQLGYSLARRWLAPMGALAAGLAAALAFPTYYFSDLLFAELPFAVVLGAFLLLDRRRDSRARFALEAGLAAAAFLLRTLGLALMLAWVGERLLARQWRAALVRLAIAALPVAGWGAWVRSVTRSDEYRHPAYEYQRADYQYHNVPYASNLRLREPFVPEAGALTTADLLQRVGRHAVALPQHLASTLTTSKRLWSNVVVRTLQPVAPQAAGRTIGHLSLWAIGLAALLGIALLAARGERRSVLAFALTAAMLCTTPWPEQFQRYLMPFAPFLAVAFVVAVKRLAGPGGPSLPARSRSILAAAAVAGLLAGGLVVARAAFRSRAIEPVALVGRSDASGGARPFYHDLPWQELDRALEWIRERAALSDRIVSSEPHYAWIRTGLRAVLPPLVVEPAEALRLLDTVPARWVVVDRLRHLDASKRYALPAVASDPSRWERVFVTSANGAQVFRRRD